MTSDFLTGHTRLWVAANAVERTVPPAAVETHITIEREALYRFQQARVPLCAGTESRRVQLFFAAGAPVVRTRFGGYQLLRYMAHPWRNVLATSGEMFKCEGNKHGLLPLRCRLVTLNAGTVRRIFPSTGDGK